LDLSENKLSHFAPGAFGHLPELKALILSDNELTEVPVFDLRNQRLEKLTLTENYITAMSGSAILMLTSLKEL
jgi:Leucine-rich repeat (LRR) protein